MIPFLWLTGQIIPPNVTADGFPILEWTPEALLGVGILLILLGKLLPRRTVNDLLNEVRADRDEWRQAHATSEQARGEMAAQVDELLEHARTTDAFIRSLGRGDPQQ